MGNGDTVTLACFTPRELEVLQLVAKGLTTQQVARQLVLSVRTVDNHVQRAMGKVGAPNRLMLVRYGIDHGLV